MTKKPVKPDLPVKAGAGKALGLLGMARRAGKTESGGFLSEKAVREGKAFCVILTEDAAGNTAKSLKNLCEFYQVPLYVRFRKEELGHALGQEERAAVAVTDEGFAKKLEALLLEIEKETGRNL